ncbi:hypothetical protein AHAS_Ahas09G0155900 [Arachis hypogaea]
MAWRAMLNPSSGTLVPVNLGVPRLRTQVARHSGNLVLACYAFELSVPRLKVGMPRPRSCLTPVSGVPCLGLQVARQSNFLELAYHAFDTKWHAQVRLRGWRAMPSTLSGMPSLQLPSVPSLDHCTSVPRHAAQVARPCICTLFKLGVPRLGLQVACQSDFFELACHAFNTKWHAVVEVLLEVASWRATPSTSSGTPIVVDGSGMPRLTWHATPLLFLPFCSLKFCTSVPRLVPGVPRTHACLDLPSGI